jgi:hypothetical protein
MIKIVKAEDKTKPDGSRFILCDVEFNGEKYSDVRWNKTELTAEEVVDKTHECILTKWEKDGKTIYFVGEEKKPKGNNQFQKSPKSLKVEVLNAISKDLGTWMTALDINDPIKVLDKLYNWVNA